MFDALGALWAGFSGELKGHLKARKQVWILLAALCGVIVITSFMIWSSAPGYINLLPDVPGVGIVAWVMAGFMSLYLAFAMAYTTGFMVERARKVPQHEASYDGMTFIIVLLTIVGMGTVEYNMQLIGAEANAKMIAGVEKTYTYSNSALQSSIAEQEASIRGIREGKLERGTSGWYDKKSKAYILNESGKGRVARLEADLSMMRKRDDVERQTALSSVQKANEKVEQAAAVWDSRISNAALWGYPLLFLLGFVLGNSTEVIQLVVRKVKALPPGEDSGTTARTHPTQPVRSVDDIVQEKLDAMAARFMPAAQPASHIVGYTTTYQPAIQPPPDEKGTAGRVNQPLPGDTYTGNMMHRTSTQVLQQYTQPVQMTNYAGMTEKELRKAKSRLNSNRSTYAPRAEGKPRDNHNVQMVEQIDREIAVIDEKLMLFQPPQ